MENKSRLDVLAMAMVALATFGLAILVYAAEIHAEEAEDVVDAIVESATPTADGTQHPNGTEPTPRESWMTPCPPDKTIEKDGSCKPLGRPAE